MGSVQARTETLNLFILLTTRLVTLVCQSTSTGITPSELKSLLLLLAKTSRQIVSSRKIRSIRKLIGANLLSRMIDRHPVSDRRRAQAVVKAVSALTEYPDRFVGDNREEWTPVDELED